MSTTAGGRRPAPTRSLVGPARRPPWLAVHMSGLALVFVAAGMWVSAAVGAVTDGRAVADLVSAGVAVAVAGAVAWRTTRVPERIGAGSALVAVVVTWVAASAAGAVPFLWAGTFGSADDALFESISGFTGTGSTVLSPIEGNPAGILFWRSMTQWYGGMGMVVLAVAVLPFLGVGGMDLLSAEAPGPTSDRLAPRVSETAKRLWLIYGGFTVVSALALGAAGMSVYDAVTHAFTVVSTGGLSPHDASIGHFRSLTVELVVVALMLVGAASFTLHWRALRGEPAAHLRDPAFRFYALLFAAAVGVLTILLVTDGAGLGSAVRSAVFNAATLITSTGFGTDDFTRWVPAAQLVLLALMVTGGMAGSTSGGVKLIRVQVMLSLARRVLVRTRHPRAVLPVRLGPEPVPEPVVSRVAGFVMLYFLFTTGGVIALALSGSDLVTSLGASISAMGNMGPGLGEAGPASNFAVFTRPARGVLMVLMLAGRLEMFPVLVAALRLGGSVAGARARLRR